MSSDQITGTPSNVVLSGTDTYSDPVTIASGATVTGDPAVTAADARGIQNDGIVAGTNTGIELQQGGSVTNTTDGIITGYKYGVVDDANGVPADITNQGYIGATTPLEFGSPRAFGVRLNAGGSVDNGTTGTIVGYKGIAFKNGYGSVNNAGTIIGYDTGISVGPEGGAVTNDATGTIISQRNFGVYIQGNGTVDNSGVIEVQQNFAYAAVEVYGGGTVINREHATIAGYGGAGVRMANYYSTPGTPSVIDNSGSISGFWGVYFNYGANGSLTNHATGSIHGDKYGVQMSDPGTVVNYGTIEGDGGIVLRLGGTIINHAGGTIIGHGSYGAVYTNNFGGDSSTLENAGTIIGLDGTAVQLEGSVTNRVIVDAGAVFTGNVVAQSSAANTLELSANDGAGTISGIGTQFQNFQTVTIDSTAQWDIGAISAATTVINAGTVGANSANGIELDAGGSVTNAHGGTIEGVGYGVLIHASAGTVDNSGVIAATGTMSDGVYLTVGGSVTNEATGTITGVYTGVALGAGGTVSNAGGISASGAGGAGVALNNGGSLINTSAVSGAYGVYIGNGGAITNSIGGTITGDYYGIKASAPVHGGLRLAPATISNDGTIANTVGTSIDHVPAAVYLGAGGTITNEADGKITGVSVGVLIGGTSGTVENAGTIIGGGDSDSVDLNGSSTNRLIVDAGASFTGDVVAKATADNTLELAAGATPGTITGLGAKYAGFETVTIDNGGTWTIAGTIGGFHGSTIQGFDTSDRLDLTDLGYSADNTFSLSNSDLLTISENGTAVATIQLSGDFTGEFFHLTDDGNHGSYVTESDSPVCYCRGTMIRTDRGEIAVEGLRIGDRVITASGQATPIRWVGRRSYSGKFAGSNPNILPICFKAGSLARNVPRRDLWVSPEHAMFIDGILIPARCLVNGDSVFQASRSDLIEYFHIELDRHDVIVAEGALSETYVDDDNRGRFHNADEFRRLYPKHAKKRGTLYCAPRLEDGVEVEQVQIAIAARALRLTWRTNRAAS